MKDLEESFHKKTNIPGLCLLGNLVFDLRAMVMQQIYNKGVLRQDQLLVQT